jgi:arylsulfatase A-like enzyme
VIDLAPVGNPEESRSAPGGFARSSRLLRVLALGLLLAGGVLYLADLGMRALFPQLPLRPLSVPRELTTVRSLPAKSGALAGRNVLLVTLDTTRADRIGVYGNREIETPNLDRLAREGVLFSQAVATAPTTLPAHASIMTGLYPNRHGARTTALFRVGEEQRTLAEVLADRGYATAAFPSAFVLDERFGLAQGFEVYDTRTTARGPSPEFTERRAEKTTDLALRWLRSTSRRPFFLWVHYYDPHAAYAPPEPYASLYPPYDGEIAYVDRHLGRLLEAVESAGPALVVVIADHGESFGDHGEYAHSYLIQETTLQIPLMMYAAGALTGGLRVDARISQVDLMPTILSLLGIDAPEGLDGVDLTQPPDPTRAIVAETLEGRVYFGWSRLSAIYQGPLKLIDGTRAALYDLSQDPLEQRDLAASRGADVVRLRRRLERIRGGNGRMLRPLGEELETEEVKRLQALGYVAEAGRTVDAAGPGPDPRDWAELMAKVNLIVHAPELAERLPDWVRLAARIRGMALPEDDAGTIRALEAITESHPDFAPAYYYLKGLYEREGRLDAAAEAADRLEALRASG